MLIKLRIGAQGLQVLDTFRHIHADLTRVVPAGGESPLESRRKYVHWVNSSVQQLRNQLSAEDVERLFLTRRYWSLQVGDHDGSIGNGQLMMEVEERRANLEETISDLDREVKRWAEAGRWPTSHEKRRCKLACCPCGVGAR
jgi:hypothetical protein